MEPRDVVVFNSRAQDDDQEQDGQHDRHGEGGDELVGFIRGDLLLCVVGRRDERY